MTRVDDEIVSVRRQVSVLLPGWLCGFGSAALEAEAVISCFDDVAAIGEELTAMELTHESFVDLAAGEVEAGQIAVGREASRLERCCAGLCWTPRCRAGGAIPRDLAGAGSRPD